MFNILFEFESVGSDTSL